MGLHIVISVDCRTYYDIWLFLELLFIFLIFLELIGVVQIAIIDAIRTNLDKDSTPMNRSFRESRTKLLDHMTH